MCFRPATTTVGARICKSCYMVCDDVTATACPSCGASFDPAEAEPSAPSAPGEPDATQAAAPGAPQAPKALGQ